jgi:hypothetical protein
VAAAERVKGRLKDAATTDAVKALGVLPKNGPPAWHSAAVWRAVAGNSSEAGLGDRLEALDGWLAGLCDSKGDNGGGAAPKKSPKKPLPGF